ncbi:MAG: sugar ABC transporter permease [Chloroflexi bacterium]|uniref:carbohydrate ABC transporter permease n=1 Tax=Candidatus Flexifilum breve TaxID=3140694 RepID=UPI0031357ACE|nr:sugar ABC transporter permease [Chloroflexota bacterium]
MNISRSVTLSKKIKPLLFIAPALIYLGIWIYYPIIRNFVLSFMDAPTPRSRDYFFVGLKNYATLFQDEVFLGAVWHNIIWVLLSIAIPVVIGFLLAVLLSGRRRSRLIYASIYFIPHTVAALIVAIVWRWIYDPNIGPLNQGLELLGLAGWTRHWLADESIVLFCLNMMGSWSYVGFVVLIFLAGLQNISPELYEAAKLDGANAVQQLIRLTIPLLRNTIMFVVVYTIINSMKFFDLVFVATNGGPNDASQIVGVYIYNIFLREGRINYGATMSTVLTAIILVSSIFIIRHIVRDQEI